MKLRIVETTDIEGDSLYILQRKYLGIWINVDKFMYLSNAEKYAYARMNGPKKQVVWEGSSK